MAKSTKKISPVDNGLAEIDSLAHADKFPVLNLDEDTIKEVQLSWAMFVDHKGGLEEAENAVMRKLQKTEPNLAVLLYGDTARPHTEDKDTDEDTGLMSRKKVETTITYDSPEGRRRMAAIMKAGQPPPDRGAGHGQEASFGGGGFAGSLAAAQAAVQAATAASAAQGQATAPPVQAKSKGDGKGKAPRTSKMSTSAVADQPAEMSRRSSGGSEPGLTEPSVTATDDSSNKAPYTPGRVPTIMVTPASPVNRPTLWRSPSSMSSESAMSRRVCL
eukprot:TRINITY_DN5188_c0_g2_i1.p1 TRINITY_DN5188_c0_g2~~TRINITY_DN5188_c0_g2_i1.p1  ORF type:complete len:292 (-),score=71.09 TRINITY_DN5188_c0_g2_i1:142-963(-)